MRLISTMSFFGLRQSVWRDQVPLLHQGGKCKRRWRQACRHHRDHPIEPNARRLPAVGSTDCVPFAL